MNCSDSNQKQQPSSQNNDQPSFKKKKKSRHVDKILMKCFKFILVSVMGGQRDGNSAINVTCRRSNITVNGNSAELVELQFDCIYFKPSDVENLFLLPGLTPRIVEIEHFRKFELAKLNPNDGGAYERFSVSSATEVKAWKSQTTENENFTCILKLVVSALSDQVFEKLEDRIDSYMHHVHISCPNLDLGFAAHEQTFVKHARELGVAGRSSSSNQGDFELATDCCNYVYDAEDDEGVVTFHFSRPRLLKIHEPGDLSLSHLVMKVAVGTVQIDPECREPRQLRLFAFSPFAVPIVGLSELRLEDRPWWMKYNLKLESCANFEGPIKPYASWELSSCNRQEVHTDIIAVISLALIDPERSRTSVERFNILQWVEREFDLIIRENSTALEVGLQEALGKTIQLSKHLKKQVIRELSVVNTVSSIKDIMQYSCNSLFRQTCFDLIGVREPAAFEDRIFHLVTDSIGRKKKKRKRSELDEEEDDD